MRIIDRIRERRDHFQQRADRGEKGSVIFWLQVFSILYQIWKLWH